MIERGTNVTAISQNDLNKILLSVAQPMENPQAKPSFFQGGTILVGNYRDIEAHNKSAILDSDLDSVLSCLKTNQPIDGFVSPVPRFTTTKESPSRFPKGLSIVSGETYCELTGFRKPTRSEESSTQDESTSKIEEIMQWIL